MKRHFTLPIFLLTAILYLGSHSARAQNLQISGKVTSKEDNSLLQGVAIRLMRLPDTVFVKGALSDADGAFKFTGLGSGSYLLRLSYIGFRRLDSVIALADASIRLGELPLTSDALWMKEVEIRAVQTRAVQKEDTTEINAAAFKTNPDATVQDLVNKMPGITTEGGTVKAQGEDVRRVLIDGREFFGDDAALALRNLPAEIVSKVQVFDRMSDQAQFTGFNDGNTEKTLNIITKRGRNMGVFGRVSAGYGTDDRYNSTLNLNWFQGARRISLIGMSNNINQQNFSSQDILGVLGTSGGGGMRMAGGMFGGGRPGGGGGGRSGGMSDFANFLVGGMGGISTTHSLGLNYADQWGKKMKLSGSYFFNNSQNDLLQNIERQFLLGESTSRQFYREDQLSDRENFNHRFSLRAEYTIDSLNSIIYTPRLSFQNNNSNTNLNGNTILLPENIPLSTSLNQSGSSTNGYTFSNDLLFRHRFLKKGRTISLNLGANLNQRDGTSTLYAENIFLRSQDTLLNDQLSLTQSDGVTYSANLTYTEPVGENGQLQFSYQPSQNLSDSDRDTKQRDPLSGAYSKVDSVLSNRFDNTTSTQRGGLSYRYNKDKIQLSAGMNYQWTGLFSEQTFPRNLSVRQPFNNLLPNASFRYNFNKSSSMRVFYRTMTQAPAITQLQNVVDNSNPLLLSAGNPDLKQSFSHFLVARFGTTQVDKGKTFLGFVSANFADNYIANASLIAQRDSLLPEGILLPRGAQLSRPVNLDGYTNLRSFFTWGLPVKFLKSNLNTNGGLSYSRLPGSINEQLNFSNTLNLNGGLVLSSNISQQVDFTLSWNANYNVVRNTLQPQLDDNYYFQMSSFKINLLPGKKWVLNTDVTHTLYTGLGEGFNLNFWLWNAGLGYKFLKQEAGELRLSAFDILKQNNSVSRTVTETYIEDNVNQVLTRYFMLTFTYTLRAFKQPPAPAGGDPSPAGRPAQGGR